MRLPLIFMVVIAHLVPFTLPEVSFGLSGNNIYTLISELFSHHVAKLSVRCYFLISGYYFFTHYSGDLKSFLKRQYKSRLKTLVIPYLIWNIITVIAILSKNKIFVFMGLQYDEIYPGIMSSNLYKILWEGPVNFPLWFIRDLICMVLISPIILYFIRYFKLFGVILLGALYVFVIEPPIIGFSMTAIFFFSLGAYFSLEKQDLLKLFEKIKLISFLLMLVFLFLALKNYGNENHEFYVRIFILFGVISIFNLFSFLNNRYVMMNKLTGFSSLSFFIYVIHEIYIINWLKGFFFNLPSYELLWVRFIVYVSIPIICMAICSMLYFLLMRIIPKIFVFSLGGRLHNYQKIIDKKAGEVNNLEKITVG